MPIEEHSSEAALRNLKSTCSMWPVRGNGNRKGLVPLPEVKPRFRIEDRVGGLNPTQTALPKSRNCAEP
jgi:hypothetical protein